MSWLWMILWGILWVLLGIIALVVLIVLLFVILLAIPIRYNVEAATGGDAGNTAFIRVGYLLRLVRMVYEYRDGAGQLKIKVAWFTLGKKKASKVAEPPRKDNPVDSNHHSLAVHSNIETSPKKAEPANKIPEHYKSFAEETPSAGWFQSLKDNYAKIKSNIDMVLTYPNRKIIIDLVLHTAKKLFKIVKPKRFIITGTVGFSDPSTTGLFVGACEAAAEYFNIRQNVRLGGNFDTAKTEASLQINAKGSISMARVALPIIRLWLKKPIRTLIRDIRNLGEDD